LPSPLEGPPQVHVPRVREFLIDNLLVRILFIIEMIWWTGLAPWEFKFPFSGSLISASLDPKPLAAVELGRNNVKGFKDFHLKNGSSQVKNLALTVLCVSNSILNGLFAPNRSVAHAERSSTGAVTLKPEARKRGTEIPHS